MKCNTTDIHSYSVCVCVCVCLSVYILRHSPTHKNEFSAPRMHALDGMKALGRAFLFLLTFGVSGEASHTEKVDRVAHAHH